jgi:zinc D-Ala-D-Ala carboxypeptidase
MTMVCPRCWGNGKEPDQSGVIGMDCGHCEGKGHCEDLYLTEHFKLSEFLYSDTAVRRRIPNDPSAAIIARLQRLVTAFVEPVRQKIGALHINSGYRSLKLNDAVNSHATSAHVAGWAADIVAPGITRKELVTDMLKLNLLFDQIIFEGTWVHVGLFKPTGEQRKQVLATYDGGKTYVPFDPNDKRIHN